MTKIRQWPFPGDSLIQRARKMALAYRQACTDNQAQLRKVLDLLHRVDPRIIGWMDDTVQAELKQILADDIPTPVGDLDQRFYEWGQDWHGEFSRHFDDDEWITTLEASKILVLNSKHITTLIHSGRLPGKMMKLPGDHTARWYILAGDVYKLSAERRTRSSRDRESADTISDSSTGGAE